MIVSVSGLVLLVVDGRLTVNAGNLKGSQIFVGPVSDEKFQIWRVSSTDSPTRQDGNQEAESDRQSHLKMFDEWH
jgi:hypothetical protein